MNGRLVESLITSISSNPASLSVFFQPAAVSMLDTAEASDHALANPSAGKKYNKASNLMGNFTKEYFHIGEAPTSAIVRDPFGFSRRDISEINRGTSI